MDSIVGPGSEWFWAAAQFVVVVISLAGIYSQLRAQASSNAFHQLATLHDRWDSEGLTRARLALALDIRFPMQGDHDRPSITPVADFFADIALLLEGGHLKRKDVWLDWNRTVEFWWALLSPEIVRRRTLYPGDYDEFERLASSMREMDRRAGRVNEFGPETTGRMLDDLISGLSARLRLEQEAKAGSIPIPPAAAVEAK